MSIKIRNEDLVLKYFDDDARAALSKYDTYIEALYDDTYSFLRDALKTAVGFLLSNKYETIKELAEENYETNSKIKERYPNKIDFLSSYCLAEYKSCSLDLVTGSGKSYLMYGIAQVMLCEGIVKKVLILCPSLTIEEELYNKFNALNKRELSQILKDINPEYVQPEVLFATETILENSICIENIHATYSRTGSSIKASFLGEGQSVLVMNDEAHHIFSGEADGKEKKWIDFLKDKNYDFKYIVNLTGTPYYGSDKNDYFNDVIYRFSMKQAVDRGVVKKINPKTFDEYKQDKDYQQIWAFHKENIKNYGQYVKPITIVVCASIVDAIFEWNELVEFIKKEENISYGDASKKAIWVTSSVPGKNTKAGKRLASILSKDAEGRAPDRIRKDNLKLLTTIDSPRSENEVEWIVSVAMLTEGWDVKNVFQIVPHKRRAFNSKLLIAQILGRGLRIPQQIKEAIGAKNVFLMINNHERWTEDIKNIYDDILEVENRLSWGYDERRSKYAFKLHNLKYEPKETTTVIEKEKAKYPSTFGFNPQQKVAKYMADFEHTPSVSYVFEERETYSIDEAVTNIYIYLKDKDPKLVHRFSKEKLRNDIVKELKDKGYDESFLSKRNYLSAQQSFGPLFRETGKKVPRVSNAPDALIELTMDSLNRQSFSEDSLKSHGFLFYTNETVDWYQSEQLRFFESLIKIPEHISNLRKEIGDGDIDNETLQIKNELLGVLIKRNEELKDHLKEIEETSFKTPLNALYTNYTPEIDFIKTLFRRVDCIDSFIKSPDKGFYSFPYSYQPETNAKTHAKHRNFNPDFFLKIAGTDDIIVVEIKKKGDDSNQNKAKYRDGKEHFNMLNTELKNSGYKERYFFKFLSNEGTDIADFFNSINEGKYRDWSSILMNQLERRYSL